MSRKQSRYVLYHLCVCVRVCVCVCVCVYMQRATYIHDKRGPIMPTPPPQKKVVTLCVLISWDLNSFIMSRKLLYTCVGFRF